MTFTLTLTDTGIFGIIVLLFMIFGLGFTVGLWYYNTYCLPEELQQ